MLSIGQNNSALEYERQIREIETEIGSAGYYGLCSVHGAHRLNMELDQSLFGLHVHSCTHWLIPRNSPPSLLLGSYTRTLLVMQLLTGAEHFGNVIDRGIIKRGCS